MLNVLSSVAAGRDVSRRRFMIATAAVSGALAIGFRPVAAPAQVLPADRTINPLATYVTIGRDNTVTIHSAHMDMGQGIYHGIATLLNEELGADWAQIRVVGGSGNVKAFGNLTWGGVTTGTGGSSGIASSFERYRLAGATARRMLVSAAAAEWRVPVVEITVDKGVLRHGSRQATFGEMAEKAAALPVPANVTLKNPRNWTYIGKDRDVVGRFDSLAKSTGRQDFTIDVTLPGMLTAVMIHPPVFGATLKSFDAARAKAVKGVVDVVAVPRGIAVVADHMWTAMKARDLVTVDWDESTGERRSSAELAAEYKALAAKPAPATAVDKGNVDTAFRGAAKVIEATFEFPYLAHAALEPLNAVARRNADGTLEVWGGHQMPDIYQQIAAGISGVEPAKVTMHVMKTGGGFGRRAVVDGDIIAEAVSVAKAIGWRAPVKVQWTRDNDMRGGRYRPAYVHTLKAGIDKDGRLVAWHNHIVGQSIITGTPFEAGYVKNGVDLMSVEGAATIPYAIPNMKVDLTTTKVGVPVLWWRAVGSTHTAYAVEAFLDEVAEAAGKDPVAFRLDLLKDHPRHVGVLRLAAEQAGWGRPLPAGRHMGVAVAESFGTYVAQIAEVSVVNGAPKVHRVVCAVDCGVAVNPDQIRAQMEGGIGFGLGAILKSQITLDKGHVVEGNFDGYQVLTMEEMPAVEVHIVSSTASPSGVGEPGVPPIGPAVANAYYAATKKRVRMLPFARGENA